MLLWTRPCSSGHSSPDMGTRRHDPEAIPTAPAARRRGDLRIGPLLGIAAALADRGVAPERACREAGVDVGLFRNPESDISLASAGRLFEAAVNLTGARHFGVLVGEHFDLSAFGPIGALMRHARTVGDALRDFIFHFHVHDRAGSPVLFSLDPSTVILGYSIHDQRTPAAEHLHATSATIAYRILRELCGPGFQCLAVQLSCDRPPDTAEYRRLFGRRVVFNAATSGVVFAASWLSKPLAAAEAARHRELRETIADVSEPMRFSERLESVLHQAILGGHVAATDIARYLGLHERTLRRRLRGEATTLRHLVNRTRFEIAGQLLRNTRLPVTEIAAAVRYADSNAFSRAFHGWASRSPREWRAAVRAIGR